MSADKSKSMVPLRRIVRKIRYLLRVLKGTDMYVRRDVSCPMARLGGDAGSWTVCTRGISSESVIYSVGVGTDIDFDLAMIDQFNVTVHAFDPTPKSIAWLSERGVPGQFRIHAVGLADFDGEAEFFPPANPENVSHTLLSDVDHGGDPIKVPMQTLDTTMQELQHDAITILKLDIEGAEYAVIRHLVTSSIRPAQILVEFHHRFAGVGVQATREAVSELKEAGYCLFHLSENGEDYSFVHEGSLSEGSNAMSEDQQ